MDREVTPSEGGCLEGITANPASLPSHLNLTKSLSPPNCRDLEPLLTPSSRPPTWTSSPGRLDQHFMVSDVAKLEQRADSRTNYANDPGGLSAFTNTYPWTYPIELLDMDGQWSWHPGHEQPAMTNQWQLGQDLPYITRDSDVYGLSARHSSSTLAPVEYIGSTYVPGHQASISQHYKQVATAMDAEQGDQSKFSQYFGSAPYGHFEPPQYDNSREVPLPSYRGRGYDGMELDDFDRRLLAANELPAAHLGSNRRLTLPVVQPGLSQRQGPSQNASSTRGYAPQVSHADGYHDDVHTGNHNHLTSNYTSFQPPAARLLSPTSPAASTLMTRPPTHRHRDLQRPLQQETPPFDSASYTLEPVDDGLRQVVAQSSPVSASSPAATASFRRQSRTRAQMPSHHQSPLPTSPQPKSIQQQQHVEPRMMSSAPETPVAHGIPLVSPRQALPNSHRFQYIFPYDWFNAVQSKCFPAAYGSTDNLVVSAPTGSGKTVILELAICKMLIDRKSENYKVVYQAPTKALCSERARDWQKKFGPQGFRCAELTGDTSQAETRRVSEATIIVTTPEKWDSITRKWKDHRRLLELVKLFLIDEVHILRDVRGATLEAVVSRMKSIGTNVRFVALSATVPNPHDVASWLGLNHTNPDLQARLETFSEEFRPVKLTRHIQGFNVMDSEHGFDKFLESKIPPLLMAHAQGKPTLIFCFTKKSSEATAAYLAQWWTTFDTDKKPWSGPSKTLPISARLRELARTGVVFHHSGLEPGDRAMVEQAFIRGDLKVICCTSTLAVGINLPCHTVVLKGTSGYQDGRLQELSDLDVLQMLGRAGRPQYDTTANAVILTHAQTVERYKKLVTGKEILESTLHLNLMEHLNSEIGLRTITDIDSAVIWLKGTFLSVRLQQNPDYYKLTDGATSVQDIDSRLREICERDIRLLGEANIVSTNSGFKQTEYGKIMARYMVGFSTMKILLGIPRGTNMEQLLGTISQANEFKDQRFQPAERTLFRELNRPNHILYPIEEIVSQTWHKIFLLVQLYLGAGNNPDVLLTQSLSPQIARSKQVVFERLQRLVRCVIDCKVHDRDSVTSRTAMELSRSLAATAWEGRPSQLQQITFVGSVKMRKLIAAGVRTVKELVTKDYGELERLWGRGPPAGKKVADVLAEFPLLSMDLALVPAPTNATGVGQRSVLVRATLRCLNKAAPLAWGGKATPLLATFMAETTSGLLVYCWRGNLDHIQAKSTFELKFTAEIEAVEDQIHCYFTCDEVVGTIVSKTLAHNIPAAMFPVKEPTTNLEILNMARVNDVVADDLDDEDMLEAAAMADTVAVHTAPHNSSPRKVQAETRDESDYDSADFPAIEDIQDVIVAVPPLRPTSATAKPRPAPTMTASAPKSTPHTQKLAGAKTTAVSKYTTGSTLMAEATTATISAQSISKVSKAVAPGVSSDVTRVPATAREEVEREPVQLPNGRWQCNHACTAGNLTKGGKLCSHKCCLEGLDKPRKLKPKTSKANEAKATGKKRKVEQDQGDTDFGSPAAGGTFSGPGSTLPKKKAKTSPWAPTDAAKPTFVALDRPATVKPTHNASWAGNEKPNYFDSDEEPIDLVGDADDDNDLPDIATLSTRLKEKRERKMKGRDSVQERWERPVNTQVAPAVGQEVIGQSSKTEADLQPSFDTDFSDFDQYFNSSDFAPHPQGQCFQEESEPGQASWFSAVDFSSGFAKDKAVEQSSRQLISGSTQTLQETARTGNVAFPVPSSYRVSNDESWLQKTPSLVGGCGMEAHGNSSSEASPPELPHEAQLSQKPPPSHSSSIPADSWWSGLFDEAEPQEATAGESRADPYWLEEFDQDLVDELRDYVNFI